MPCAGPLTLSPAREETGAPCLSPRLPLIHSFEHRGHPPVHTCCGPYARQRSPSALPGHCSSPPRALDKDRPAMAPLRLQSHRAQDPPLPIALSAILLLQALRKAGPAGSLETQSHWLRPRPIKTTRPNERSRRRTAGRLELECGVTIAAARGTPGGREGGPRRRSDAEPEARSSGGGNTTCLRAPSGGPPVTKASAALRLGPVTPTGCLPIQQRSNQSGPKPGVKLMRAEVNS